MCTVLDIYFARLADHVIQAVERYLDDVIFGIVHDSEQRQPLGFDLIAEPKGENLNFRPLALKHPRDAVEERGPLSFVELVRGHGTDSRWVRWS